VKRLESRTAIVTGAGSGIGEATAVVFAEHGALVAVADVEAGKARLVASRICDSGGTARPFAVDVADSRQVGEMVRAVISEFGRIDVLVNNAGIIDADTATNTTEEMWDRQIDVNLKGTFLCSKAVLSEMVRQGGGSIVNVASISGVLPGAAEAAYAASKGGIILLTQSMAIDYARHKIRVNAVSPGWVRTPMALRDIERGGGWDAMQPVINRVQPIGRLGEPREVANLILFLASDEASLLTGANVMVDGGYTAGKW
jgi:dihydroanticapsin dehydrogenase